MCSASMYANADLEREAFEFFWKQFQNMHVTPLPNGIKTAIFHTFWMSRAGLHAIVNETEYNNLTFHSAVDMQCFPIFKQGNHT